MFSILQAIFLFLYTILCTTELNKKIRKCSNGNLKITKLEENFSAKHFMIKFEEYIAVVDIKLCLIDSTSKSQSTLSDYNILKHSHITKLENDNNISINGYIASPILKSQTPVKKRNFSITTSTPKNNISKNMKRIKKNLNFSIDETIFEIDDDDIDIENGNLDFKPEIKEKEVQTNTILNNSENSIITCDHFVPIAKSICQFILEKKQMQIEKHYNDVSEFLSNQTGGYDYNNLNLNEKLLFAIDIQKSDSIFIEKEQIINILRDSNNLEKVLGKKIDLYFEIFAVRNLEEISFMKTDVFCIDNANEFESSLKKLAEERSLDPENNDSISMFFKKINFKTLFIFLISTMIFLFLLWNLLNTNNRKLNLLEDQDSDESEI